MYDSIFASEKVLDTCVQLCPAAWKAFKSSRDHYEHPDSNLIVLRVQSGVVFMLREEAADEEIAFKRFDVDYFDFCMRLVEAAVIQNSHDEAAAERKPVRTSGSAEEANDV